MLEVEARMTRTQKVIQCAICGHEMVIPPGFEHAIGHCRICGGVVSASSSPPASRLDDTMRSARPKPKLKRWEQLRSIRSAAVHGIVRGIIGALAGGVLMAALVLIRGNANGRTTIATFFASPDTGMVAGFVICSSWAVIRRLSLNRIMGAALGASVAAVLGTLTHIIERFLALRPDMSWGTLLLTLIGGGVAGYIIAARVGAPD